MRKWTDEEIEFIRQNVSDKQCSVLLEMINQKFGKNYDLNQLYRLKYRLKLRSPNAGSFRKGERSSPETEFKKGLVPWNKGTHYHAGGRSIETQFKKGTIPPNHVPVGSERMSYGKIQIKIAEPNVWENLSTLVWQSVHGKPLPKGCVIRFINGDITDYSPDNLIAVTRAQNLQLNHLNIQTYDIDSMKAALLDIEIRSQISKRKQEK